MEFGYHVVSLFPTSWKGRDLSADLLLQVGGSWKKWIIPRTFCCWHVAVLMAGQVRRNISSSELCICCLFFLLLLGFLLETLMCKRILACGRALNHSVAALSFS